MHKPYPLQKDTFIPYINKPQYYYYDSPSGSRVFFGNWGIAENVMMGKINIKPNYFVIILGAMETSLLSGVKKKSKSKSGLCGLKQDAANIYAYFLKKGSTYLGQIEMNGCSKNQFCTQLKNIINGKNGIAIYYSGHGSQEGNWIGKDFQFSKEDYKNCVNQTNCLTALFIDACHSGNWINISSNRTLVIASCQAKQTCWDWGFDYGSAFTYELTHSGIFAFENLGACPAYSLITDSFGIVDRKDWFKVAKKKMWAQQF